MRNTTASYTDLDPHFALRNWAVIDVRARIRRAADRERTEQTALAHSA